MHLVTPPHPPAKNNHCFQYLLDIKVVPREIEDNGYLFIYAHFFRSFVLGGGGEGTNCIMVYVKMVT